MPVKTTTDIQRKAKASKEIETRQFNLIETLYDEVVESTQFYPKSGDVAREEHVQKPIEALVSDSIEMQNSLGNLLEKVSELQISVELVESQLTEQLNYLVNEANFWKIQNEPETDDVIIIEESFAPGLTLPFTDKKPFNERISSVTFSQTGGRVRAVRSSGVTAPVSENLPSPFYAFGEPFSDNLIEDPTDAISNQRPILFQAIYLIGSLKPRDTYKFLNREFEAPANLVPIIHPKIEWHQDLVTPRNRGLRFNSPITIKFKEPIQMSYVELDIEPFIVHSVDITDFHGNLISYPAAEIIYFPPTMTQTIRINLREILPTGFTKSSIFNNLAKIQYPLSARIVTTRQGGENVSYVYYIDEVAKTLRELL